MNDDKKVLIKEAILRELPARLRRHLRVWSTIEVDPFIVITPNFVTGKLLHAKGTFCYRKRNGLFGGSSMVRMKFTVNGKLKIVRVEEESTYQAESVSRSIAAR